MLKPNEFLKDLTIHPHYQPQLIKWLRPWRLKTYVDILIVVDTEISISASNSFGIATVIDLIRTSQVGCMKFRVDIAVRSNGALSVAANPGNEQAKYNGFRFNSTHSGSDIIDKYEQIWCFGFKPNNSGSSDDSIIDQNFALPASNAELEKLDSWMTEKKGGIFGTGDHHFLGASMCRKIPRLGTMRRWTNADGVPPIGTPDRIDTLRPPSAAYMPGAPGGPLALGNSSHQGDLTVQSIQWVTWKSIFGPFFKKKRPHPVLCHPTMGPIDVMPDHAHEGLCVPAPNLSASKQFNSELEYPDASGGGTKPQPEVIAYGSNLSEPPYNFVKGAQPARSNNPMIAVYDGHKAGVGRVATDSTWHHWMDVNIDNMKAANNDDWKKISRYYINLAVWLNPPGYSTKCFYLSVISSHIQTVGFQEYNFDARRADLGISLAEHLKLVYGPCWVTERIWDIIWELELIPRPKIPDFIKLLDELEVDTTRLEHLVLGSMVKATLKQAEQMKSVSFDDKKSRVKALDKPEKLFAEPIMGALRDFTKDVGRNQKSRKKLESVLKK